MPVDISISLTGANGDTITFDDSTYILMQGASGFGVPTTSLRISESASDGGVFRATKRGIREFDLPVAVIGSDRGDVETKLRRLSNLLRNVNGATTMTASYSDGTAYSIQVYYAGGADATRGSDANLYFARWVLNLQAPSPFWTSSAASTITVQQSGIGRGMLPKLSRLQLTGNQAIGTVVVNNTAGDVPSFPVWKLYGPMDNASIYVGTTGFTYNATIAAGEVITIDTAKKTVVDSAGTNKYANLSSAPKFFSLPPGTTSVSVLGNNTTTASKIALSYYPRREVIH